LPTVGLAPSSPDASSPPQPATARAIASREVVTNERNGVRTQAEGWLSWAMLPTASPRDS
jgi:hypothetical protein